LSLVFQGTKKRKRVIEISSSRLLSKNKKKTSRDENDNFKAHPANTMKAQKTHNNTTKKLLPQ